MNIPAEVLAKVLFRLNLAIEFEPKGSVADEIFKAIALLASVKEKPTKRALHVSEISPEDIDAIAKAEVPKEHAHLNNELDMGDASTREDEGAREQCARQPAPDAITTSPATDAENNGGEALSPARRDKAYVWFENKWTPNDPEVTETILKALKSAQPKVEEVTETDALYILGNAFGNLPITKSMPQTWRSILQFLADKYPSGLKIVRGDE